jgi:hypothetical protein
MMDHFVQGKARHLDIVLGAHEIAGTRTMKTNPQ